MKPTIKRNRQQKKTETIYEPVKWLDEYTNYTTGIVQPVTDKHLKQMCVDMVKFAMRPTTLTISAYFNSLGIDPRIPEEWRKRWEHFDRAYLVAKRIIGERREVGALQKQLDPSMAIRMMGFYDNDWKELAEWMAKLRAEADNNTKANVIVLSELDYKKTAGSDKL